MEMTTIIGIIIAIVIILMGLYILLRGDSEAKGATESLNRHAQSQQPIVPRHLRATLLGKQRHEKASHAVDASSASSDSANLSSLNADQTNQQDANDQSLEVQQPNDEQLAFDLDATQTPTRTAVDITPTAAIASDLDQQHKNDPTTQHLVSGNLLDDHLGEQQRRDSEADISNADHVITLKVMANPRRALSGDKALKVMLKYGLRYGELSCFHRHEQPDQDSALLFSVLRITDFGFAGFDLENLSTEQVQGLAFFMTFPHQKGLVGFDTMASNAHLIAQEIEGRIFDENHQELTPQLKMHWRDHVIDYIAKH